MGYKRDIAYSDGFTAGYKAAAETAKKDRVCGNRLLTAAMNHDLADREWWTSWAEQAKTFIEFGG